MSRSARGTSGAIALALVAAFVIAPLAVPAAQATTDWSAVPGAQPTDLIVTPYSSYQSKYLDPGFSYTARPGGMADYCAATDPAGAWPCPNTDYSSYFHINSTKVYDGLQATVNLTVTKAPDGFDWLGIDSSHHDFWEQVFSPTSHGWLYHAEVIGGRQIGQLDDYEIICTVGVPCDVSFSLRDDYGYFTGQQWIAASIYRGGTVFIPLNPTPPATPPTAAFSAALSGTAAHDWNFDASGSTAVSPATVASYQWTFGDGATATTSTPTTHHTYADGSPHTASLVVVDSGGTSSASVSHQFTEPALIVNSTGDAPATDPSKGCDTGGTVGTPAVPECTLRAAIESLDAGVGGTKITFALPAGSTTISTGSALPDITKAGATIDGTETSGMPTISGSPLHIKAAPGVTITKVSVISSGDNGVFFDDSPGGVLTSSMIGVSPSGTVAAPKWAVDAYASGSVTIGGPGVGNVIVGTAHGVVVFATGPITSLVVQDNSIGESTDGALFSTTSLLGVGIFENSAIPMSGVVVSGNRIAGSDTNLSLVSAGISAPQITGNVIGVAADQDSLLGAARVNLRLDGVPGAVVSGNQIAGAGFDVFDSASVQVTFDSDGGTEGSANIHYRYPGGVGLDGPLSTAITGTHDTISGNRIGTVTRHPRANVPVGIDVWNLADDTAITGNTVLNHDQEEITVFGTGARLVVSGNTLGALSAAEVGTGTGIELRGMPGPTVSQNSGGGLYSGIDLASDVSAAVVSGNTVGFAADGSTALPVTFGISVAGAGATVGPNNTAGNASRAGIYVSGAGAHVVSNRVGAARFGTTAAPNLAGIDVAAGATATVIGGPGAGNTIVGNVRGVQLDGAGAEVANNTFGTITSGALGNGTAIDAAAAASIHDNTIANSTLQAITAKSPAVVTMLHNSITGTVGGIGVTGAFAPPVVVAAERVVHGSSARTFLVLRGVSTATGTIEVFGNASCADPEGRYPLFTTPTTSDANRVISVADRTDLAGLTVMVTTSAGTTRFSNCETSAPGEDTDADGIPDLVEFLYPQLTGMATNAKTAAFVGDNQKWVLVTASKGTLANVSPIDDPDPLGHTGATFPLGLIDWTVNGIEPGSLGGVGFTLPGTVINGWWKYSPHHSPQFFDYGYSTIAGYGAKVTALDIPGIGLSTEIAVLVPDGGVGDDDGLENGSIHDPAAPAVVPGDAELPPSQILPYQGSSTAVQSQTKVLSMTGTDPTGNVLVGILAVLVGAALVVRRQVLARRRKAA